MKPRQSLPIFLCAGALMATTSCASLLTTNRETVAVTSTPPEANVIVNGIHHGTTPVSLRLHTNQSRPPRVSIIKKGHAPISVPLQRQINPLTFLNFTNILGYGVDWATGAMFKLRPNTIAVLLGQQNALQARETSDPPEVALGEGRRPWWIHSYGKIYAGYRVPRMVGNTLVVLSEGATEEEVPLENIYSISGAERPNPNVRVKTGLLAVGGGWVGGLLGMAAGLALNSISTTNPEQGGTMPPMVIGSGIGGAVLGAMHATRLAPAPYDPPAIQAIMAEWSLAEKRGWIKNNMLR
jgi:hypothetical protein